MSQYQSFIQLGGIKVFYLLLSILIHIIHVTDIYIYMLLLATFVEGDQKAPFSIATTPRCRGGRYSFPWR